VLNKTDLVDRAAADAIEHEVRALNSRASLHRTTRAQIDPEAVIAASGTQVVNDGKDHSHCDHEHDHCEHTPDKHAHSAGSGQAHAHEHYLSMTLKPHGKADKARFNDFLNEGLPGLLRLKGFVQVHGVEPQAIVQWTAGDWEMIPRPEILKPKPDVLVFIGEELDRGLIRQRLESCGLHFHDGHEHHHHHDHEHAHHHEH
jgi:G3E family GTPase